MSQGSRRHLCIAALGVALPWRAWAAFDFTAEELTFGRKTYEVGAIAVLADGIKAELK